ncbi:hypothetical protein HPB51_010070 [Rhipicephalus microplus]|uniref:Uncharacterized protein n=1 Tax=Rhipicephalus microplus TaxID=6941 RepID=A0A9J6F0M8_RHIMP|nr:hypothetical protein HPB51_010070 [Rhipicephalus microplus]
MPARKGLLAPQNTFLDTIATRFDGTPVPPLRSRARACLQQPSRLGKYATGAEERENAGRDPRTREIPQRSAALDEAPA